MKPGDTDWLLAGRPVSFSDFTPLSQTAYSYLSQLGMCHQTPLLLCVAGSCCSLWTRRPRDSHIALLHSSYLAHFGRESSCFICVAAFHFRKET